ncbi:MAG: hypothetical protein WDO18_23365 [Acidobacteriota bacterium]
MATLSTLLALVLLGATAGVAVLVAKLVRYRTESRQDDEFQAARYAAMDSLLDPQEIAFLASQPGMTTQDVAAFTRKRRQIFRMYLRELSADFHSLHAQARELVTVSPDANPELVSMLMSQQVRFWMAIFRVECELTLHAAGIRVVNPSELLDTVRGLHEAIVRATAMPGPIAVN